MNMGLWKIQQSWRIKSESQLLLSIFLPSWVTFSMYHFRPSGVHIHMDMWLHIHAFLENRIGIRYCLAIFLLCFFLLVLYSGDFFIVVHAIKPLSLTLVSALFYNRMTFILVDSVGGLFFHVRPRRGSLLSLERLGFRILWWFWCIFLSHL